MRFTTLPVARHPSSLTEKTPVRYMGEWKNDQKNGAARVVYGNGDRFEGSFKDGYRTGVGTVAWHGIHSPWPTADWIPKTWMMLVSWSEAPISHCLPIWGCMGRNMTSSRHLLHRSSKSKKSIKLTPIILTMLSLLLMYCLYCSPCNPFASQTECLGGCAVTGAESTSPKLIV